MLVSMSTNPTNLLVLWNKERYSPIMHVNEVSKNVGEKEHLQKLVETFTNQETCWWGTHQFQIQMWKTRLTYFIEIFGGKKAYRQSTHKQIFT